MVFRALSTVKVKVEIKPVVDSFVFKLHYTYTRAIFLICAVLSTLHDVVGKKIDCLPEPDDHHDDHHEDPFKEVVNNYCFIMGTFTVDQHHGGKVGVDVAHPGIGPYREGKDPVTYHTYYQWVPFVLLLQALLFYLPHLVWKSMEGGMFKSIIQRLSIRDYLGSGAGIENYFARENQFVGLSKYFRHNMRDNSFWGYKFFMCESMNLLVVVGMIYFTDSFLGGEFLTYGADVFKILQEDPENRTDPMSMVFPKMGKCNFKSFGPSGTIEIKDVMCVIATNIINEKIYVFLWVWLLLLSAVTIVWILGRLLTAILPPIRSFILKMYVKKSAHQEMYDVLRVHPTLSEWLLLLNLGRNMDDGVFTEFIIHLSKDVIHSRDISLINVENSNLLT